MLYNRAGAIVAMNVGNDLSMATDNYCEMESFILSWTELEFLRNPSNFLTKYAKSLRHRLHKKVELLQDKLKILVKAGSWL